MCTATAAAALTLHGVWNSHRARQMNGLPVKISATQYVAARCGSTANRNCVAYYAEFYIRFSSFQNYCIIFTIFHEVFHTLHKSIPLCKAPKIPRLTSRKTTYFPSAYHLYWPRAVAFAFGFVLSDSPIKSKYAFPSFLRQATCPTYLNAFDWTILIFARGT